MWIDKKFDIKWIYLLWIVKYCVFTLMVKNDLWIHQSARLQFSGVLRRCVYFYWESKCYCHFCDPTWVNEADISKYHYVTQHIKRYQLLEDCHDFDLWGCKVKISQIMVPTSILIFHIFWNLQYLKQYYEMWYGRGKILHFTFFIIH